MLEKYLEFSEALIDSVQDNPAVLGLVFLGSTADNSRIDQWSDHDFFLIVTPESGEKFRKDLSWLPNHTEITLAPRETAHGLKVVYSSGNVLEFAVFEDAELELAAINSYLVPVDKKDIATRCSDIARRSAPSTINPETELELFLCLILIGVGRNRRGEFLSAGQFIRSYALEKFLILVSENLAPQPNTAHLEDNLNRFRRFEIRYPVLGGQINQAIQGNLEEFAKWLYDHAQEIVPSTDKTNNQFEIIARRLGW